MSRVGKKPVNLPENVQVEIDHKVVVKGPLGELSVGLPKEIKVEKKENNLFISRRNESKEARSLHGLMRSLIANMVEGVTSGFKKTLELSGIGFRANLAGSKLVLSVGFSHPIEVEPPEDITFAISGNKVTVSGINKELVGRISAQIRAIRPPDVYKGKGIRYEGEAVRRKPGKAAKVGVGGSG
ncbi:MAG TPA: 50S ribosomal protein L6 [Candidatus Nanoarchaeia archaeon]